jgi:Zn-dependent protease
MSSSWYTRHMNLSNLYLFVPCLLVAMTLHEAAHAYASYMLGDHTAKLDGRLSLNPLVHIDPLLTVLLPISMILMGLPPIMAAKPVPFNPYAVKYGEFGAALVAIAGPVSNLVVAIFSAIVLRIIGGTQMSSVLIYFIGLNVSLAVFNLIPWPPLDGSRVLYALAPDSAKKIMDRIEGFGMGGLFIFMLIVFPFVSPFIAGIKTYILGFLV